MARVRFPFPLTLSLSPRERGTDFQRPALSRARKFTTHGSKFSLSAGERAGVRIRRNQISRIEPLNLKMRNILIINRLILRFMGRASVFICQMVPVKIM